MLGVLLLAAALRWMRPGLVEFKYDEVNITRMALGLADRGPLPVLSGGTTLGIQRGALDVYLLALPLTLISRHVEAAVWWLAALGVVAVALTYVLGRRVGGPAVGLMAALFMAVNPWLITYDRKLWAHIQVVFQRPAAHTGVGRGRAPKALGGLLLPGCGRAADAGSRPGGRPGFELARRVPGFSPALAAARDGVWVVGRRRPADPLRLGAGDPLVNAQRRGGANVRSDGHRIHIIGAWHDSRGLVAGVLLVCGRRDEQSGWANFSVERRMAGRRLDRDPVALLIAAGLVRTALRARAWLTSNGARLLLAWTVGPAVVFSLGLLPIPTQYWTVLLPLPALYLALGLDGIGAWWARRASPRAAGVGVAAFAFLVALTWAGSYAALLAAVDAGAGARAFGVPLARWQDVTSATREWAARLGTQEVRVAVDGVDPGYDSEPAAVAMLIGSPPWARFVAPQEPAALLLSHERPSLYLWTIEDAETEALLGRVGEQVWQQSLGAGRADARLYRLPPAASADLGIPLTPLSPEPAFDAGMALVGYAFPETIHAAEEAEVTLVWRVLDPPPEVRQRDFTAFNHVVTGSDTLVAQVDGLALLSRDWWPGDVLIQRYRIVAPAPGIYTWRVGLYSRVDGGRSQLTTGGDFVDLAPLVVR